MSLGTTEGWLGAVIFGNWYLESLSISHFTTSGSITEYWQGMMSVLIDFLILIHLRTYWCPHHYEFRNHRGVAWCCFFFNWYVDSLGICHFTTSASITEYWQGMVSVLINFLELIRPRTYWCPHHYEFRNHRGVDWWYSHLQLVRGQFEYMPFLYKCFHHRVLARNDDRFDKFPGFDPS